MSKDFYTQANADSWIGKRVKQVTCTPGNERFVGRVGTVDEAIADENGRIHCKTAPDGVWCPASLLSVLEDEYHGPGYDDEGPTSQPEDPRADRDTEGGF